MRTTLIITLVAAASSGPAAAATPPLSDAGGDQLYIADSNLATVWRVPISGGTPRT